MKLIITLSILGLIVTSCSIQDTCNVTGEISGLKNDTLIIFANDPVINKSVCIDTIPVKDNKFSTNLPDSIILSIGIYEKSYGNGALRMSANEFFTLLPGEKLKIKGDINNLKAYGTEIYDELAKIESINEIKEKNILLVTDFQKSIRNNNKEVADSLRKELAQNSKNLSLKKLEYIKNNPKSLASGFLYTSLMIEHIDEASRYLDKSVNNGPLSKLIDKTQDIYKTEMAKRKAKENIVPGKDAPDFLLKNLNNEDVTLASFRGKYALLDFWGTWCGWCIKGIPEMKKYYAKYKNRMEIVGICCGDTEEKWRNGVKELDLPWTNLYNGIDKEITTNYAISGYPTKVLINPEGKIVEVFIGESEELYKKLDVLLIHE
ncbi:TlpA disulfide reductase family protein [uncultured Bacteroides sp.]|uniref:TlpA disulfide reductase family protein n=1 Tax=uncultured Bacteroides sp. TaxID=162156 RepID=UPI00263229BD|nr:TlpA disulfide reductase family protein [uncultured Bacteroides sp.]